MCQGLLFQFRLSIFFGGGGGAGGVYVRFLEHRTEFNNEFVWH